MKKNIFSFFWNFCKITKSKLIYSIVFCILSTCFPLSAQLHISGGATLVEYKNDKLEITTSRNQLKKKSPKKAIHANKKNRKEIKIINRLITLSPHNATKEKIYSKESTEKFGVHHTTVEQFVLSQSQISLKGILAFYSTNIFLEYVDSISNNYFETDKRRSIIVIKNFRIRPPPSLYI